jgi:hypothetical protein
MPPTTPEKPSHNQQQVGAMLQFLRMRGMEPEAIHDTPHFLPKLPTPNTTTDRIHHWLHKLNVPTFEINPDDPTLNVLYVTDISGPGKNFLVVGTNAIQCASLATTICPGTIGINHHHVPISTLQSSKFLDESRDLA